MREIAPGIQKKYQKGELAGMYVEKRLMQV